MGEGAPASSSSCEIRIGNQLSEIERVADLVDEFGARHQLANEVIVAVNVSLDEVINNIISYGYDDAAEHEILVRLDLRGPQIEIVVEDDARAFDPLSVGPPDLSSPDRIGGVGLHFIRNLMDRLEYARQDGVNQLRLTKKLGA